MIGILFIYFIGKYFFKLAEDFNQNKWLYAILGIAMYYAGTLLGGVLLGLFSGLSGMDIDWDNSTLMAVLALPFGLATVYLFYYLLKKKWEKAVVAVDEIQDIGNSAE
jgi:hypothetical protein